jgi:diguanylate cyclase (GGDEF)-like protein
MQEAPIPCNDAERLETLRALRILDSAPEERFDRLTRMARRMFGVPISLVSIVDSNRQWFKSAQGLEATETPRAVSFCGHAILGDEVFMIEDASQDQRFHDNPLVTGSPNVRFYAGCPLRVANGHKMGTLCLIGDKPRTLDAEERQLLEDLASMAEQEIAALQLATLDELTGISNRRGFLALGRHALAMCDRYQQSAVLIVLDLDRFKPINDRFGHAEGDRALLAFANLLREIFRDSDVYARTGGDEFIALLTGADEAGAQESLARFRDALAIYNREARRGYDIACSAGYVLRPAGDARSIETLTEEADRMMYARKKDKQSRRPGSEA